MAGSNTNYHPSLPAQDQGGQNMAESTNNTPRCAPLDVPSHKRALVAVYEIFPIRHTPPPQGPDAALAAVIGTPRGVRGVSWSHVEREILCTVYVEATPNAEVGIDQRLETFKKDYSSRSRARLPEEMPRVERRGSRSTSAIFKDLRYIIFPTVDRLRNSYVSMVRYKLTGNPTPAGVRNAALAMYHGMRPYEVFKAEVAAKLDKNPLRLWNVLKQLDRFSGSATMEALGCPRHSAPDSVDEVDDEEDLLNEPTSSTYARTKKQRRQSGFQERPTGTKAAKNFSRIEAALQQESVAHTTALKSISKSKAERSSVAFYASPVAASTEEIRAWWARKASRRQRDEPDGHHVASTNA